jgi:hemerythrin-like metal-binding protein
VELSWTNDLSVGNRFIDYAHKEVLGKINLIVSLIGAGEVAALSEAFELLENCLCPCFAVEENIAQAADVDFTQHKRAHQRLLSEFKRIRDELMSKNGMWSKSEKRAYAVSLRHCLIRHLKEESKSLTVVLDTHFYDFKPSCMLMA